MSLQDYAKQRIVEFGGLDCYLKQLKEITPLVPPHLLYHIKEIEMYYILMHEIKFDMENDFIVYRSRIISAIDMFENIYKHHGNLFAKLMFNILSEGCNRTEKIRLIS